jgi:ketosteroid isomerase-like protein
MSDESHRLKVERFFDCINQRDFDGMQDVVHEDFVQEWPQSGERIRGLANVRAVLANYPGLPDIDVKKIHGSGDRWFVSPSYTLLRVTGTGDQYTTEQLLHYPNGEQWHVVGIFEFRDGKVAKLTNYFAAPFSAPEWRSQWVEKMEETPPPTKG